MVEINLGSKPIEKLIDVFASGTGAVFAPWQLRRMARAEADAMVIRTDGAARARDRLLEAGELTEEDDQAVEVLALPPNPEAALGTLRERAERRLLFQEAKRQENLEAIGRGAAEELPEEVSEEAVDEDWIARFFQAAQDVSAEDMQTLWSRLLAGEIERPGRSSLRTIELLRNLSQEEAELIAKIGQFEIHRLIFYHPDAFWDSQGLRFNDFLIAQELGLLEMGGGKPGLTWRMDSKEKSRFIGYLEYGDHVIGIEHEDPAYKMRFGCYKFTMAGAEILRIAQPDRLEAYPRILASEILKKHKNCTVGVARILRRNPDGNADLSDFDMVDAE